MKQKLKLLILFVMVIIVIMVILVIMVIIIIIVARVIVVIKVLISFKCWTVGNGMVIFRTQFLSGNRMVPTT
jgi:hypothetical protein